MLRKQLCHDTLCTMKSGNKIVQYQVFMNKKHNKLVLSSSNLEMLLKEKGI
jgi:hypothetical protein